LRIARRAPAPRRAEHGRSLDLVTQMAELGTRDVGLIGGEAYLRKDWLEIVAAVRAAGMECGLQSGGRNLTDDRLAKAAAAGLQGVGISIDGLSRGS
jgi:MoaA/NifB/PqqE/SkfB family radical SAM enzyme